MNNRRISSMLVASACTGILSTAMSAPAWADSAPSVSNVAAKSILWNGQVLSSPIGFVANGTTYMPLFYIQDLLRKLNITNTWDGHSWTISPPSGIAVDLSHPTPGNLPNQLVVNGVPLYSVEGIAYTDPSTGQLTTFMPIWYIQQILHRLHIQDAWDGKVWAITTSSLSTTSTSGSNSTGPSTGSAANSIWQAGVIAGAHSQGQTVEDWWKSGTPSFQLNALSYDPTDNKIPLSGTFSNGWSGDLMVEVCQNIANGLDWKYSIPVNNGSFSATIEIPFSGSNCINVAPILVSSDGSIGIDQDHAYYTNVTNQQPTLSDTRLALLQSWMVNDNESPVFLTQAKSILATVPGANTAATPSANTVDAEIKAVSDWVSHNIQYNFPAESANTVPWQQITTTYVSRVGVCQDEAALAAGLLRTVGIPTRTVSGSAHDTWGGGPHQWDMAWDGNRWLIFDPTWDQTYYSSGIHLPDAVNDNWFDMSQSLYQAHYQEDADPYHW